MVTTPQENRKFTVTRRASQLMTEHFAGKERSPIRVFVLLGGCGIRTFSIALEPPKNTDEIFEIAGFTYIIDKKLLEFVHPVCIDSDGIGFRMSGAGIHPAGGCGSCGSACGVRGGSRCPGDCMTCPFQCGNSRKARHAE